MKISGIRSILYTLAKLLGDVNAVPMGTVGKRVQQRIAGKTTRRGLGKPFK
jgi:hypothetical protein